MNRVVERGDLLLRGRDIDFYSGSRLVFSCSEVSLFSGEVLHIIGSNGVGKTSLLRILSGLISCDSGFDLFLGGRILYIGHEDGLTDELTILEHIDLWRCLGGVKSSFNLLSFARDWFAEDLLDCRVIDCSAGERRKLSLLRLCFGVCGASSDFRIWLLDEPFSSLDLTVRSRFLDLFRVHCGFGGGIIMTGHGVGDLSAKSLTGLAVRIFGMDNL